MHCCSVEVQFNCVIQEIYVVLYYSLYSHLDTYGHLPQRLS